MNWKLYIGLLSVVAAIALAVAFWPRDEAGSTDAGRAGESSSQLDRPVPDRDETFRTGEPGDRETSDERSPARKPTLATDEPEEQRSEADDRRAPSGEREEEARRSSADRDVGAIAQLELPDGGIETEDTRPWKDPTNQRVLGDKRWMAPVSEEEEQRIDEVFEKARAARRDPSLSNFDRRLSIERAREIVDGCFAQLQSRRPGAQGRIIVGWTTGAAMGTGWIRNARIVTNVGLEEERFEQCIRQGLEGVNYPADDGDAIEVEYPFFYEGR